MISSSVSNGVTTLQLLAPIDAADTAAATGTGIDVSTLSGFLIVTQSVGVVDAGSVTGTIITSAAANMGTPTTVGTFTAVTTSNDPLSQSISIELNQCQQYIAYLGTIVTGGALVSCTAVGRTNG